MSTSKVLTRLEAKALYDKYKDPLEAEKFLEFQESVFTEVMAAIKATAEKGKNGVTIGWLENTGAFDFVKNRLVALGYDLEDYQTSEGCVYPGMRVVEKGAVYWN